MAVNKVVANGQTIMDLSTTTLTTPSQISGGLIAHSKNGETLTGTMNSASYSTETGAVSEKGTDRYNTSDRGEF